MNRLWIQSLAVAAIGFVMGSANAAVSTMPKGSATAGQAAAAVCAACHGADGNSMVPMYPRLAGQNPQYTFKQIKDFKAGTRSNAIMAPMAAMLTTDQMTADVAAYFASQKPSVSLSVDGDSYSAGEKIYRGGDAKRGIVPCAGCHGPAGKGNNLATFPKIGGQHADYLKTQLTAFRAAGRGDLTGDKRANDATKAGEQGMMQMVASKLSDQDIANLANFLTGLH